MFVAHLAVDAIQVLFASHHLGLDMAFGQSLLDGAEDFSNDFAPLRMARDLGFAIFNRTMPLKRLAMRHAMGIVGKLPRLVQGRPL